MPTNHDVVAVIPTAAVDVDKTGLRNILVKRLAYVLAAADNAQDLVAVDPDTGATILAIAKNGYLFAYDATDTTTVHDGVTCLVSYDGKRYKRDGVTQPYSVIDKDLTAPPDVSPGPAYGDAYLLYSTPSGDWAGQIGKIAIFTARDWEFVDPPVGFQLYVEDEDGYYHKDAGGNWDAGIGTFTVQDDSVSPLALINMSAGGVLRVENQTTNAEPDASPGPAVGDAYVIGPNPTGTWAGHAGKIGLCVVDGVFLSPITPQAGWTIYDKAVGAYYRWTGTAWVSQSGGFTQATDYLKWYPEALSTSGSNNAGYEYSHRTPPTSTQNRRIEDTLSVPVTAEFAGQIIEVNFLASFTASALTLTGGTLDGLTIGVFVDSEVNARDWMKVYNGDFQTTMAVSALIDVLFHVILADTSAHTLKIMLFPRAGGGNSISGGTITLSRQRLNVTMRSSDETVQGSEVETWLSSTYVGDMTGGGGLAATFNGNTGQTATNSSTGTSVTDGYVGILLGQSSKISKATVHGSNTQGYVNGANPSTTIQLYGKAGGAPTSSTDGTLLGSITFTDTGNEATGRDITSSDTDTEWDYVWARIVPDTTRTIYMAQMRLFK